MITSRFLEHGEYSQYGDWLRSLSRDTLATYFGAAVSDSYIDSTVERVMANKSGHWFLVAEDCDRVVGLLHIAMVDDTSVEFAISVSESHRRQGIGDRLMSDAIVWCRNRLFLNIHLHCLRSNGPVRRLCERHRLRTVTEEGDSDASARLLMPSFYTIFRETERNVSDLVIRAMRSLSVTAVKNL